jgi:epoxide hydrolase-like predicted phosphatase
VALDALLIDWGGVLTTSMIGSFDAFSAREGLPEHAVRQAFRDDPTARDALIELECGRIDIVTFEARLAGILHVPSEDLARRLTAEVQPDHEMRAAVRDFHDRGVKTALVSNSWRREDYDVLDLFDVVVLSGDLGVRKPDPEIYAVAVERLGVTPDRCVFVDDLGGNLKPAKGLGMTTIRHDATSATIAQLKRLLWLARPS